MRCEWNVTLCLAYIQSVDETGTGGTYALICSTCPGIGIGIYPNLSVREMKNMGFARVSTFFSLSKSRCYLDLFPFPESLSVVTYEL
jgi:hypothetical protein